MVPWGRGRAFWRNFACVRGMKSLRGDGWRDGDRVPARLTVAVTVAALLVTAAVALIPQLHFAYRNEALHLRLDAAEGVVGLVVAYLMFGRFRENCRLADLGLVLALTTFAVTNLVLSGLIDALAPRTESSFLVWAPVATRTVGALVFVVSAWPIRRKVDRPELGLWLVVATVLIGVGAITAGTFLFADSLPVGVRTGAPLGDTVRPNLEGHPWLLTAQAVQLLFLSVAALRFTKRSITERDELLGWFGAGAALGAVARLNYLIFPSLYTAYVYVGDAMRFGFYLFLLIGAAREIRGYWTARSAAAVLDERRRMARDLHDGLAQELVFVAAQSRRIERRGARDGELEAVARASDRALSDARRAIAALTRPLDEPLDKTIEEVTEQLAVRAGVSYRVEVPSVRVPAPMREDLVRIVTEAISNATRHGAASNVTVEISTDDVLRLRVTDDGRGFDVSEARPRWSFGLASMQERAEALDGTFLVTSRRGEGTQVEVSLPFPNP